MTSIDKFTDTLLLDSHFNILYHKNHLSDNFQEGEKKKSNEIIERMKNFKVRESQTTNFILLKNGISAVFQCNDFWLVICSEGGIGEVMLEKTMDMLFGAIQILFGTDPSLSDLFIGFSRVILLFEEIVIDGQPGCMDINELIDKIRNPGFSPSSNNPSKIRQLGLFKL